MRQVTLLSWCLIHVLWSLQELTYCDETNTVIVVPGHLVCRDLSSYLVAMSCANRSYLELYDKDRVGQVQQPLSSTSAFGVNRDETTRQRKQSWHNNREKGSVSTGNALMLLSSMSFMKLQICYFGNMALRSSLSFAVIGSLLAAVIPVLVRE